MGKRANLVRKGAASLGVALLFTVVGCGTTDTGQNKTATNGTNATNTSTNSTSTTNTTNTSNASGKQMTAKLVTVRYSEVIRSIFYAPQYVAMSEGFFKKDNLNVQMVTSQASNTGAAALLSGSADIALVGPETSVFIYNQQGNNKLKVFYQLTNTDGSFILSHKKINNFKWSDLQGKSIVSWRPGSAPEMVLSHDLKTKGVKANVITNIGPSAMVGAFESGKADFVQVYEPVASQLVQSGKAYYDASVGQVIGNYPETAFEATSNYIQSHPTVIQNWTDAVNKATQWMNTHSSTEVAQAIKPYFPGTSTALIASSIQRYQKLHTWSTPVLTPSALSTLQSILIENGTEKASQKVTYSDVVDPTFAEKATK